MLQKLEVGSVTTSQGAYGSFSLPDTERRHMTYQLFSAKPRLLPVDGGEYSVSVEPAQALLHEPSDRTAVLPGEIWQQAAKQVNKRCALQVELLREKVRVSAEIASLPLLALRLIALNLDRVVTSRPRIRADESCFS